MIYEEAKKILQTYTLEEILELNDLDEEELLCLLINDGYLKLPEILPA